MLKGNYSFTGILACLDAINGGFDSTGHPVNPQFSVYANIPISGVMNFDGVGTSTQKGNFVETVLPGSSLNTSTVPGVSSGPFAIAASPYSVAFDGSVKVIPGVTTFSGLTGADVGISGVATLVSGEFTGKLSRNGSLLLTTAVPLIQNVAIFVQGNQVASFPRQCSVTMTLTP